MPALLEQIDAVEVIIEGLESMRVHLLFVLLKAPNASIVFILSSTLCFIEKGGQGF